LKKDVEFRNIKQEKERVKKERNKLKEKEEERKAKQKQKEEKKGKSGGFTERKETKYTRGKRNRKGNK